MALRYVRNTAILAKIETTVGTDAVPTGAANALLVSNLSINPLDETNVDRDLVRNYFGGSEQLVGTANISCSFDVELAGSGSLGVAAGWGPLVRACGFGETITATTRVDYTPISTAFEAVTIYWYDDGVLHKLLGARGTFTVKAGLGDRPVLSFKFIGLNGGVTAAALPTTTLTAFQKPLVVTDTNTGDVTVGCTYSAGALSGGTVYPSRGIEVDIGNNVNHVPLLGGESIEITGRTVTGSIQLDLTAAQEVTFMTSVTSNTTQGIGIQHGTTTGNIVILHGPAVQLINPSKAELNGKRLCGYDLRFVPTSGNDDFRICIK